MAAAETAPLLSQPRPTRLLSIDVYRGFVMLAMVSRGFGFPQIAKEYPNSRFWQELAYQFDHVPWVGCSFWDLIQPSFMFLVGTSLAFSYAARKERGQSYSEMLSHAAVRSILLILLGIFLRSNGQERTNFTFVDVTTQIGLGYFFLFLLAGKPRWVQWLAAGAILVGYWLVFVLYPAPTSDFDWSSVGVKEPWTHFTGAAAHFEKNANAASAFDVWFINLFPLKEPFRFNPGGYATLNFVPSLATMIFGLIAGELLRSSANGRRKFWTLVVFAFAGLAAGYLLHVLNLCPIVKRIWTPSWTLYSAGWTLLLLAAFYAAVELGNWRAWTFPFAVVGMNSIAIYCLDKLIHPWIIQTFQTHLGPDVFKRFGDEYQPLVQNVTAMFVLWLICYWMYQRKLFLRL
jgi:heparan-alpha-glucosaminide N-acetyltransferase